MSRPTEKRVWGLGVWERWLTMVLLDAFLPGLSQAETHAQGFHWRRLRRPPKDPNFPPHLRPSPGPSKPPKLPAAVPGRPAPGPGQGVLGEGPLGSRLASVVDARHPVARPVRTAGGGATRPAVMDGARSGARKAIYGARAHRDRFGSAK